jgi:hypothetical protein
VLLLDFVQSRVLILMLAVVRIAAMSCLMVNLGGPYGGVMKRK